MPRTRLATPTCRCWPWLQAASGGGSGATTPARLLAHRVRITALSRRARRCTHGAAARAWRLHACAARAAAARASQEPRWCGADSVRTPAHMRWRTCMRVYVSAWRVVWPSLHVRQHTPSARIKRVRGSGLHAAAQAHASRREQPRDALNCAPSGCLRADCARRSSVAVRLLHASLAAAAESRAAADAARRRVFFVV